MAERAIAKPITENVQERVRGPKLRLIARTSEGVSFRKALEIADKANRVLASNKRLSRALVETGEWKNMKEAFRCWAGTIAGYSKPGAKLGEFIEYTDPYNNQKYVFPVPEQYRGEKDAVLVAEHPDYALVPDGKNLVVVASKVDLILQFPKQDGWYKGDDEHDIPCGKERDSWGSRMRYLWRAENRVGLVDRDEFNRHVRRCVSLYDRPQSNFKVVVEAP